MTRIEGLSLAALKARTARAHVRAERSGVVADLLARRASRQTFALFLRNLAPAYAALESSLAAAPPPVSALFCPGVARSAALERDLSSLAGPGWRDLAVTPAAGAYAARIRDLGRGRQELLVAHAYVRYFGDLNGGRILKRLVAEALGLPPDFLGFYDFPDIADMPAFLVAYRAGYERVLQSARDAEAVLAEAEAAFEFNIAVSEETQAYAHEAPVV